jgi:hypothetical protein
MNIEITGENELKLNVKVAKNLTKVVMEEL